MMWLKLFLCIIGLNFGESEIVKRACQDAIPNCSEYTTGICSDPLYSNWVIDKCAKFCNKCKAPTAPPVPVIPSVTSATGCVDTLSNCHEYGRNVCTDMNYEQWVTANCANFCLKCPSGAPTLVPPTTVPTAPPVPVIPSITSATGCVDTISNCHEYGRSVCTDMNYEQWVTANCAKFCLKCPSGAPTLVPPTTVPTAPPVPVIPGVTSATGCVDKLPNCHEYGRNVCTDMNYEQWVTANCANFCLKCPSGAPTLVPPTTDGTCRDTISNCDVYTKSVCNDTQYDSWVLKHCALYCNRCVCEDNVANCADLQQRVQICADPTSRIYVDQNCRLTCGLCTGGSNLPDNCRDGLPNCKDYGATICTDTNYYQWVKQNCPKTCNMCPVTTTTPSAIVGPSIGCVYVGQVYQEGETWKDGCKYLCSCEDGATGKYLCNEMCLTWNLPTQCHMAPAPPGKCCATPSCPVGITINYPSGYVEH